ncbi:hypothetical protein ACOMHN_019485 [Nucella lapillus]
MSLTKRRLSYGKVTTTAANPDVEKAVKESDVPSLVVVDTETPSTVGDSTTLEESTEDGVDHIMSLAKGGVLQVLAAAAAATRNSERSCTLESSSFSSASVSLGDVEPEISVERGW